VEASPLVDRRSNITGVANLRPVAPALVLLLLAGTLPMPAAECNCSTVKERDSWCEVHAIGYIAGLGIRTYVLFEALDAHGHEVDPAAFPCPNCRRAIEADGFCEEHRVGFVSGLAYFSRLTFLVASARATGGSAVPCPECRKVAQQNGWCDACGGAGFIGPVRFPGKRAYQEVVRALELVRRADVVGQRCAQCAAAMVTDSICPVCKLDYRDGVAHPFVPRGPSGRTAPAQPSAATRDN